MSFEVYLSPPHMSGKERALIQEAFDSNWIAPLGPHVDRFESEMANYLGTGIHALAVSSGTAAIHLALRLLGVGLGDRVICSTLTFIGSAGPIAYQGAKPVFIDSEDYSWNICPKALEKALIEAKKDGKLPKAAILVNLYGQSCDLDPLVEICNHYGVPIIEDAAESLGATYKNRKSGTFGRFGVLSFNGNKIITTSGGGMLLSHDKKAIDQARFLATQARDPAKHYQHSEIGYNYRMSNLLAAVGRAQLAVLDDRVEARRNIFDLYYNGLAECPGVTFMPEADFGRSTRWLTVMLLDPKKIQAMPVELIDHLASHGIEARPVWKPLHLQPVFQQEAFYSAHSATPLSESLFQNGICLPSGSQMSPEVQQNIIRKIREFIN